MHIIYRKWNQLIEILENTDAKNNKDMFIEIRKSGTDAVLKGYGFGLDKKKTKLFLDKFLNYKGDLTDTYRALIPSEFYDNLFDLSRKIYLDFLHQGM